MKKALVVGLLVSALIAAFPGAQVSAKAPKATVLATDPADDWGAGAGVPAPIGDFLGQELVSASMSGDSKTLNLIFGLNSLPPWGGIPESSRYNWDFTENGTAYQATGGFTEFLRGTCNPLHTGECPPPQATAPGTFFIRQGPCTVGADCFVVGRVVATFDPAEATVTVPIPLSVIKAKPGAKIGPASSTLGGGVYTAPAAMVSQAAFPNDQIMVLKTYTIPK